MYYVVELDTPMNLAAYVIERADTPADAAAVCAARLARAEHCEGVSIVAVHTLQ